MIGDDFQLVCVFALCICFWISLLLVFSVIIGFAYYLQHTRVHQLMAMATQRRKGYSYLWMYLSYICIVFVMYVHCIIIVFAFYLSYICIFASVLCCICSVLQPMAIASQKRKRYLSSTRLKFDCIFVLVCNTVQCNNYGRKTSTLVLWYFSAILIPSWVDLFMVKMMTEAGTDIPIMAWVEGIPYSSAHWVWIL